ncbi:predicted protein [Naegleria gruberi]|uniref:Predicted protein n=1 Tax=Naegleria gruberi TaxID=5762 RepID=D2V8G1_NAEGR|nr:uncharacterized protein NAEGRDRAFT_57455 [Naegleria gruberi]EFC46803.1 predicted protein [Naegleria gruberi]|eukprot:XP_002679547.1 predicted protein [Naegleria gruberi strain NEG-M]
MTNRKATPRLRLSSTSCIYLIILIIVGICMSHSSHAQHTCTGVESTQIGTSGVCSGHGLCTGDDECTCLDITTSTALISNQNNIMTAGATFSSLYFGQYYLQMQTSGNLVLFDNSAGSNYASWMSGTYKKGTAPYQLKLETNGTLAIYGNGNVVKTLSEACTGGTAPFALVLQNNGDLVLYGSDGYVCWSTDYSDGSAPNYGYVGSTCQTPVCFNVNATSDAVCSGHGTCTSPNSCNCNSGYGNANCQTFVCGGTLAGSYNVCSGRGKGACVKPNNCSCQNGYSGESCQTYYCYGTFNNNTGVCSGNGVCSSSNVCTCKSGYYGNMCENYDCNGKLYNNSGVCSEKGSCVSPNNCSCIVGYGGDDCDKFQCFGLLSNDSKVCSGNGKCNGAEICSCNSGYYGQQCENFNCSNISKNSSSVCSGFGVCSSPNNCTCFSGYNGTNCQTYQCSGFDYSDPLVCSGKGSCISPNNCSCIAGYGGNNCEKFQCYGLLSNDSKVCSGNGKCNGADICSCNSGYYGQQCENYNCSNISKNSSSVCSGFGVCSSPNNCTCFSGYNGTNCQTYQCSGFDYSDPLACSGKGSCISPNNCSCIAGYSGSNCGTYYCNSVVYSDKNVCSGRGSCTQPNKCNCTSRYSGSNCESFSCFGYNFNSSLACSSNGSCIAPNICSCKSGFNGSNCESYSCHDIQFNSSNVCSGLGSCVSPNNCNCSKNYYGSTCSQFNCYGINYLNSTVCSGNGKCLDYNTCNCTANWFGPSCSVTKCFGINSNNTSVCNGKGTCTGNDICSCNANYFGTKCELTTCNSVSSNSSNVCSSKGTCISYNECSCQSGYSSTDCSVNLNPLVISLKKSSGVYYQNVTSVSLEIISDEFSSLASSNLVYQWICENCQGNTNTSTPFNQTNDRILMVNPSELKAPALYIFSANVFYTNPKGFASRVSNTVKFNMTVLVVPVVDVNVPSLDIFGLPSVYVGKQLAAGKAIEAVVSKVALNQSIVQSFLGCEGNCSSSLTFSWSVSMMVKSTLTNIFKSTGLITGYTRQGNSLLFTPAITLSTTNYISGSSYVVISLAIFNSANKNMTGSVTIPIISAASAPEGDLVTLDRTSGYALTDYFTITFNQWAAAEQLQPLQYAIGFTDPTSLKQIRLTEYSANLTISTYLPYISTDKKVTVGSLGLLVYVKDSLGNSDLLETLSVNVTAFNGTSSQLSSRIGELTGVAVTVASYDQSYLVASSGSGGNADLVSQIVQNIKIDPTNPATALSSFQALTSSSDSVNDKVVDQVTTKMSSFADSLTDLYKKEIEQYGYVRSKISQDDVKSAIEISGNLLQSGVGADKTTEVTSKMAALVLLSQVPTVLDSSSSELPAVTISTPLINITISSFKLSGPTSGNQTLSSGDSSIGMDISSILAKYDGFSKSAGTSLISYQNLPFSNNFTESTPSTSIANDFKFLQEGSVLPLANLTTPIILSFKLNLDLSTVSNYSSNTSTFACRYYDERSGAWSTDGCTLVGYNPATQMIDCACTHTTMFSTFLEQKTIEMTPIVKQVVTGLYSAQIAFGIFYFVMSTIILTLLIIFRKEQPISSRLGTPYLGMIALIIESVLVYIIQRSVLVSQLYSGNSQMWEAGDTAANVIANIVAILVNTLNLTAILSYVLQVFRFQFMKYLYQLIAKTRGDEKKSERIFKMLRYTTSTALFVTIVCVFAGINLLYWTLWVILVRTGAISSAAYTYIVSISYTTTVFVFSVMIILVTIFDFVGSHKQEKERVARASSKRKEPTSEFDVNTINFKKNYTNPFKKLYTWFISLDGPLYFRMEMMLYILCFIFLFFNQVLGLSSLSFRFQSEEMFQKALVTDMVSFIFEVLYVFTYMLTFGGYALLVLANYKIKGKVRNTERASEPENRQSSNDEIINKDMSVVLDNEEGYGLFEVFCEKEFSLENIYLFTDIKTNKSFLDSNDLERLPKFSKYIYNNYIKTNAPTEVNIPSKCRNAFLFLYKSIIKKNESYELFSVDIEAVDQDIKVATKNAPVPVIEIEEKVVKETFENLNRQILINLGDTFSRFVFTSEYTVFNKAHTLQQQLLEEANVVYIV